jgi:hypothetical protein
VANEGGSPEVDIREEKESAILDLLPQEVIQYGVTWFSEVAMFD